LSGSNAAYCRRSSIHQQNIWGDKSKRQLIENRYSPYVPKAEVAVSRKQTVNGNDNNLRS
jgi:hypothetical protein